MKKLKISQMENLQGGKLLPCGQALVIGSMFGGMFGGVGAIVGLVGAAVGGNCLGWM